jgi:hypothetical protein
LAVAGILTHLAVRWGSEASPAAKALPLYVVLVGGGVPLVLSLALKLVRRAPFTGLKPAGRDLGPAIPAADRALEERSLEPLVTLLTDTMRDRLRQHFHEAVTAHTYDVGDVAAGREYVRAYVEFIHYVERLYEASTTGAHGHFEETGATPREHR